MWDILKETTFGENVKHGITEINVSGAILSDPKVIAEEFNNFFTSIGQTTVSLTISPHRTQTLRTILPIMIP